MKTPLAHRFAYAAAAWAFGFGGLSVYWALGGAWLLHTQSRQILTLIDEPWFVAALWLTGLLKVAAGLLALSLAARWGRRFPARLRRGGAWSVGVALTLYGGANLAVRGLMALGLIATPATMHTPEATWHLVLWDPWFVLGGVLFVFSAAYSRPRTLGAGTAAAHRDVRDGRSTPGC